MSTLDSEGDFESLPFMPEMLPYCGGTFEVGARADKTCDTVNLLGCNRKMSGTVHLQGARCDGSAHGGCQAGCLLFFKEEWLEPVRDDEPRKPDEPAARELPAADRARLDAATARSEGAYRCQATQLLDATRPMWDGDVWQYVRDVRTRNAAPLTVLRAVFFIALNQYQGLSRRFLPRWLRVAGGASLPVVRGSLTQTPTERLDLVPGEVVEVRGRAEILATLDGNLRNRGLSFDVEMTRYCGKRARVLRRVTKIIDEKSGRMVPMKNDCIVLEEVVCRGDYHRLCPRAIYPYWREIWLRRVDHAPFSAAGDSAG
jgi:hypothetical protein